MCKCGVRRLFIFKCGCDGILIRAFELTGLCCGQPGAPNSVVQRLCLQVQVAVLREVRGDGSLVMSVFVGFCFGPCTYMWMYIYVVHYVYFGYSDVP